MSLFDIFKKKEEANNEKETIISFGNGCVASKKIFDGNYKIGYMTREIPSGKYPDSGWRFFVGDEDEEYTRDSNNIKLYALESIIKYDSDIEKYLQYPTGSKLIRINEHEFIIDDGVSEIYISKRMINNN